MPELGRPITAAADLAYRKRSSAERQAEMWNEVLEHDPTFGAESGFRVGVAPIASQLDDGPRWELIWIHAAPGRA